MFFRKASGSVPERRSSARGANASDEQLKELRTKARRRLIGALALVLAAILVVPPLFDTPVPVQPREPIVVPAAPSGLASAPVAGGPVEAGTVAGAPPPAAGDSAVSAGAAPVSDPATQPPVATPASSATDASAQVADDAAAPARPSKPLAETADEAAAPTPPTSPKPVQRTDDGAVALALLAGKTPVQADKPAQPRAQGNFVLQVAAYTTEQDASRRRDSLVESGVTNAYVERALSGDRAVYRLRVGPFPTHEAAQAAQTRLRALGYQNGLISGK